MKLKDYFDKYFYLHLDGTWCCKNCNYSVEEGCDCYKMIPKKTKCQHSYWKDSETKILKCEICDKISNYKIPPPNQIIN
jgi:hypothetical protein